MKSSTPDEIDDFYVARLPRDKDSQTHNFPHPSLHISLALPISVFLYLVFIVRFFLYLLRGVFQIACFPLHICPTDKHMSIHILTYPRKKERQKS